MTFLEVNFLIAAALLGFGCNEPRRVRDLEKRNVLSCLPSTDFAFGSSARSVRHLSIEKPETAFADGPASVDSDPTTGLVKVELGSP
jgi:hypothetical protein